MGSGESGLCPMKRIVPDEVGSDEVVQQVEVAVVEPLGETVDDGLVLC